MMPLGLESLSTPVDGNIPSFHFVLESIIYDIQDVLFQYLCAHWIFAGIQLVLSGKH